MSGKAKKEQLKEKRITQNCISYEKMLKSGVAILPNNHYSQTEKIEDINYKIATEEDQQSILGRYMGLLNSVGNDVHLQLTVCNHPISEEELINSIVKEDLDDGYDELRNEINESIIHKIRSGTGRIISDKYITYSIKEDNVEVAKKSLNIIHDTLEKKLFDLGTKSTVLNGEERLKVLKTIMSPYSKASYDYTTLGPGYTTKDLIAPDKFDFAVDKNYFKIDDRYAKVMFLKTWATELNDSLITSLATIEHNITLSFHMKIFERNSGIAFVKNKIAKMDIEMNNKRQQRISRNEDPDKLPLNLTYSYNEADCLLEDLEKRNERLFLTELLIMINADDLDELEEANKAVNSVVQNLSCELGNLFMRQEEGLNAIFPLGLPISGKGRMITTKACAIIMPFTSVEIMQKDNPIYYGVNQTTGNLILCNRNKLKNANAWLLAASGSGKSFKVKQEFSQVLCYRPDADVIIIDPQGEYAYVAKDSMYHGSIVEVSNRANTYFNPFEGDYDNIEGFVKIKVDFAQTFMTEVMGCDKLRPTQTSIIDMCVKKMYQDYEDKRFMKKDVAMPTLHDFRNSLLSLDNSDAQEMAMALYTYTEGSYDMFAKNSNVQIENRLIVFDISQIGDVMRSLGYKIILETLRDRILQNFKLGKETYIYFDEIYLVLKDEYAERFIYEFFKWARKFGAIVTGITQNVEELLARVNTRTMIGNAESIFMLNQSKSDLLQLRDLLGLSSEQMRVCMDAPKGYGLMKYGESIIPFKDEYPKNTKTYDLWTTDPNETKNRRKSSVNLQK